MRWIAPGGLYAWNSTMKPKTHELKEILLVDGKVPIVPAIGFILQSIGYLVKLAPNSEIKKGN